MFCQNCNNVVGEGVNICPNCGTKLNMIQQPEQQIYTQSQNNDYQQLSNNKKRNKPIIIIIFGLLVVFGIVFGIYKYLVKDDNKTESINSNIQETTFKDGPFLMAINDVFTLNGGRNTVVTGNIERGIIKLNDEVQIIGLNNEIVTTKVTGIIKRRKRFDSATSGEAAGIILENILIDDIKVGQVLAEPDSIKPVKKFEANVDIFTKKEGKKTPFFKNSQQQFYFRTADITGEIIDLGEYEMVMPGDKNVKMSVSLSDNVAIEIGTEFDIRENEKVVAKGTVTKIY